MFDDFIKKCAMENKLRISNERIEAQTNSVLARVKAEQADNDFDSDYETGYGDNAQPKVYYVQKRSLLKTIIPIAAAAAAIAIALPIGVKYLRKDRDEISSAGSTSVSSAQSNNDNDYPAISLGQSVDFKAQYIRTNVYSTIIGDRYPKTYRITSKSELDDYNDRNKTVYCLGEPSEAWDDGIISYCGTVSGYDEKFFREHDLIFVVLQEASGSISHTVTDVICPNIPSVSSVPPICPVIERNVPEWCDDDMAEWHIIIEVGKNLGNGRIYPVIDGETVYPVPQLRDIVRMTSEEAEQALWGFTDKEIYEWWGKPAWSFSGMYGACWQSDGRQIIMHFFDDGSGKFTAQHISTGDIPTEEEMREIRFRNGITSTVNNAETIEQLRQTLSEIDGEKRITKVEVLENGREILSGYLQDFDKPRTVRIYYDEDKVLEVECPAIEQLNFDYIVNDTVDVPQEDGIWLNYYMREFPDVVIRVHGGTISCGDAVIISGDSIKVAFTADLNGDNRREICAVVTDDKGVETFYAYDLKAGKLYMHNPSGKSPDYEIGTFGTETYLIDNAANEKILLDTSKTLRECN